MICDGFISKMEIERNKKKKHTDHIYRNVFNERPKRWQYIYTYEETWR